MLCSPSPPTPKLTNEQRTRDVHPRACTADMSPARKTETTRHTHTHTCSAALSACQSRMNWYVGRSVGSVIDMKYASINEWVCMGPAEYVRVVRMCVHYVCVHSEHTHVRSLANARARLYPFNPSGQMFCEIKVTESLFFTWTDAPTLPQNRVSPSGSLIFQQLSFAGSPLQGPMRYCTRDGRIYVEDALNWGLWIYWDLSEHASTRKITSGLLKRTRRRNRTVCVCAPHQPPTTRAPGPFVPLFSAQRCARPHARQSAAFHLIKLRARARDASVPKSKTTTLALDWVGGGEPVHVCLCVCMCILALVCFLVDSETVVSLQLRQNEKRFSYGKCWFIAFE